MNLRNKSVFAFFMLNALFILVVFLLQLNKDQLHVNWPLGIKLNVTILPEENKVKIKLFEAVENDSKYGLNFINPFLIFLGRVGHLH